MVGNILGEIAFELGKVLLKTHLEKGETAGVIQDHGGAADERVILQKFGKFWNQRNWLDRPDGLVVVTTHRLAFLSKVKSFTVETDFLSFPFDTMSDVTAARVMFVSPAFKFAVNGEPFVFTFFANAEEVVDAIAAQRGARELTPCGTACRDR